MLGELGQILGVTFRDDLDIGYINLVHIEGSKRFYKEADTLHLNLAELDQEEVDAVLELNTDQFDDLGRVLRHEEEVETRAMESGFDQELQEILSYFDDILSERYNEILDSALHLRAVIEEQDLSKREIQERKGQIARERGANAIYICSLVSAGYFDPDGGLRDLYVNLGLNQEYDRYQFQSILEEHVDKRLICVFIENDDSVPDATQEVRGGLERYQREDPIQEWFDVRGIGDGCAEVIDGVLENLEEEYLGIDYDQWRDEDDIWVRIYPRSLPSF